MGIIDNIIEFGKPKRKTLPHLLLQLKGDDKPHIYKITYRRLMGGEIEYKETRVKGHTVFLGPNYVGVAEGKGPDGNVTFVTTLDMLDSCVNESAEVSEPVTASQVMTARAKARKTPEAADV